MLTPKATRALLFAFLAVLAVAGVTYTFTAAVQYSAFAAAFAKAALAVAVFWAVDAYLLTEINTVDEIKSGNTAYGLFLVALALVVAATISTG